jgi:hypothetical protein
MEIGHIGEKVVTLEPIVRKQIEERRKQTNDMGMKANC